MDDGYLSFIEERKSSVHIFKYKYYLLALPAIAATILLLFTDIGLEIQFRSHEIRLAWSRLDDFQYVDLSEASYFIKTEGCTIPAFDPFEASILKYYHSVEPIACHNRTNPPLVESNLTHLWIEEKYFANFSIFEKSRLTCCYRPFHRPDANESASDNRHRYARNCTVFESAARIEDEFVRVECEHGGTQIYKDFHSFVPIRESKKGTTPESRANFNVLILGIDAVSRLNFHRTMPETLKYLKEAGASEFKGYNKVGDNTYPNLVPLLSGLTERELDSLCVPAGDSTFDGCPFLWKMFDERGYFTAFAEDASQIALFNYLKRGFAGTPTDYYWRTFNYLAEAEIGHEKRLNAKLCLGPRMTVDVLLAYVYKVAKALSDRLFFGFFWETSLTHDFLNYPLLGDRKYSALMERLGSEGLLERTVVIVLSDHGIRWGEIRTTHQGRMEERLPFLFISLPSVFKERYPLASSNVRRNTRRLTTPFDLHETLLDLLNTTRIEDEKIREKIKNNTFDESRGISLFLPINENRTCQSAGIDPHWCTCHRARKIEITDRAVVKVANLIVRHINDLLEDYYQCATLNLTEILDARIAEPSESLEMSGVSHVVQDYTVVVHTEPGEGLFEGTARRARGGWNVTGAVSRINLYGKQSYCVDNYHLKLYCYCQNTITKLNIF